MEMMEYHVSGEAATYMNWKTKRESKSMYMHAYSEKSFIGEDMARVFNRTWAMFYDEIQQALLHPKREHVFDAQHSPVYWGGIFTPRNDVSMYHFDRQEYVRYYHQIGSAAHKRHPTLSVDDECFMWKFIRRTDDQGWFDISIRGKYGSTSAVAGNRLPMLESYFQLVDWESLVIRSIFDLTLDYIVDLLYQQQNNCQSKLVPYSMLVAYSSLITCNLKVYCQGVNEILVILLQYLDEDQALRGLTLLIEVLLPAYHVDSMIGLNTDCAVMNTLLR
ncbi:hypothetical protein PsorP6_009138 [Peronosclerospora sorghi]|uniref:Uncharacterized protein n=1 Tax=Peronosclerospora sorghi TaxID=230839 RepID=A0ACC0VYT0_9STRA|nr:hypothetical protein PsorP6_009138 [Peronosclerospora sorghi]